MDKFKNLLLYILEKSAGKPNVGETVLDLSWLATREENEINYELYFYRDAPFPAGNFGEETGKQ